MADKKNKKDTKTSKAKEIKADAKETKTGEPKKTCTQSLNAGRANRW